MFSLVTEEKHDKNDAIVWSDCRRPGSFNLHLNKRSVPVEFVVVKFPVREVGLKAFQFSLTRNIPLILNIHTFIYHRRYTNMEVMENDNNAYKIKLAEVLKEKAFKTEIIHWIKAILFS